MTVRPSARLSAAQTAAVVSRPAVEVADVLHAQGDAFMAAEGGGPIATLPDADKPAGQDVLHEAAQKLRGRQRHRAPLGAVRIILPAKMAWTAGRPTAARLIRAFETVPPISRSTSAGAQW
jgi:hypothetical protein